MSQTRINNDNIQENTIRPGKLSTGAPTWDTSSNLNVGGTITVSTDLNAGGSINANTFVGSGSALTGVYRQGQTISEYVTADGFQGDASRLTGNFNGNIANSTGINNDINSTFVSRLTSGSIFGNLTVFGTISASGGVTITQSNTTGTSALSVVNNGVGPALYVKQGGPYDIATFIDAEGGTILHINNISPMDASEPGGVGILTEKPNETLTVKGTISASSVIYSGSGIQVSGPITSTGTVSANRVSSATLFTSAGQIKALSGINGVVVNNNANTSFTVLSVDPVFINQNVSNTYNILQEDFGFYSSFWG
jgi:hypothetical protein